MGKRDEYVGILKSTFIAIETRVTIMLLASLPAPFGAFFSIPVIKKICEVLLKKFYTKKAEQAEIKAFFYYTDMRVGSQSKPFEDAAYANHIAQKSGDPSVIKKAEDDLWDKFTVFAKFTS